MNINFWSANKTFSKIIFLLLIEVILITGTPWLPGLLAESWIILSIRMVPLIVLLFVINNELIVPIKILTKASRSISDGKVDKVEMKVKNELAELALNIDKIDIRIARATSFAEKIGEGHFEMTLSDNNEDFGLAKALNDMRNKLSEIAEDEKKRNWSIEGIARFSGIFRDNLNTEIKEFCHLVISNLVKYLGANQGGVYITNDYDPSDVYIEMTGCYAYERRKHLEIRIEKDEGLIGQCIREGDTIYITDVPDDYIKITSGIGEANPTAILIVPIKVNEIVFGAIEIASFTEFDQYQIDFVNSIAESFASTLSAVKSTLITRKLLDESRAVTEELREKESELMHNEQELREAQETVSNKLVELQAETNLTKCILDAINKSNACIEFDMDGNILNANEMFLSVMGHEKAEIIGKNEKMMVPEDEINSQRYDMLWESLNKGNFNTGEFRRYARNGKEIWIEATYNPILDLKGNAYKILMFANFTTEAKEKENDYRNKINAINKSFLFIEINPDFSLKSVNQMFLDLMQYKRKDIKELNFKTIIDIPQNNKEEISRLLQESAKVTVISKKLSMVSTTGESMDFMATMSPSTDITGKLTNYFAIMVPLNNN